MDKLDAIFSLQASLNDEIAEKRGLPTLGEDEWLQKLTLAMLSELSEVLDETNFKWWKNNKPLDSDAIRGELVDILHFFVSMCLRAGMTADELYARYLKKNQVNHDRQRGLTDKPGYDVREESAGGVNLPPAE